MQPLVHLAMASWILAIVCLAVVQPAMGQGKDVHIVARRVSDGVMLRWAPSTPEAFAEGRRDGYRLERASVSATGAIGTFQPVLDGAPFKPYEQEAFDFLAYTFRASDSSRLMYRQFAYSVLYEAMDATLNAQEAAEALQVQFGFALLAADRDTIASLALGLAFQDEEVVREQRYAYRVTLESRRGQPQASDTVVVEAQVYRPTAKQDRVGVDPGDGEVTLSWPSTLGYSAYLIQRSDDNGNTWMPLTSAPMLTLITGDTVPGDEFHRDTALINYRTYRYRLYGYTSFADEELVADVIATPRDRTPPDMPTAVRAEELRPGVVDITWEVPEPVSPDLAAFFVARGTADEGPFTRLSGPLPSNARQYLDSSGRLASANYYVVEAVDTAGNVARSFSAYVVLADSTPPAAPVLREGVVDSNGVVTLRFERPADRDYMGYRLLRANDSTHEFSVVAERLTNDTLDVSNETEYKDTIELRTLTRNVYYRMYALDFHHNESAPSELLRIVRPDVVPPVAPVITGYLVTDSSMIIDYVESSSDDVARHVLLRKAASALTWDTAAVLSAGSRRVEDAASLPSEMYDYAVVAIDEAGLFSDISNIVSGKRYDTGVRPPVNDVRAQYDSVARVVTLVWDYRDLPEDHNFVIYRTDGDRLQTHAVVPRGAGRTYVDRVLPSSVEIRYAIKVVTENGAESVLSQSVSVNVR